MTDIIVDDKQAQINRHARINEQELVMMTKLQRSEVLVYIQIKMLCWKDGEKTDYTNAQFALATGVSEESVKRSISRLEELGRISRHTVMRSINGVAKSHRWITLTPFQDALLGVTHDPQCEQVVLGVTHDPQCDVANETSGGSPMTPPGVTRDPQGGVTHDPQSLGVTHDPLLNKDLKQAAEAAEEEDTLAHIGETLAGLDGEPDEPPLPEQKFAPISEPEEEDMSWLTLVARSTPAVQATPPPEESASNTGWEDAVAEANRRCDKARPYLHRNQYKPKPKHAPISQSEARARVSSNSKLLAAQRELDERRSGVAG